MTVEEILRAIIERSPTDGVEGSVAAGIQMLREHGHIREPAALVEGARASGDWSGVSVDDLLGAGPIIDRDAGDEGRDA